MSQPLAYRMRPRKIEEVIGQQHLVGPGKIIDRMVRAQRLTSMILYGPPGTGKTSIASAIAGSTQHAFRVLNAATDSKKDIEVVVEEANMSGTVILLLDEIHRLNKVKQDYLLPHLESGRVILIGATTENPYISINPAIRSRVQIFEVKPLTSDEIVEGLTNALYDSERGLGHYQVEMDDSTLRHFAHVTNGDIRSALNSLELAVLSTEANEDGKVVITQDIAEECLQRKRLAHDKDGDAHYDTISALQKSIRGSDVDAALYYLAILLEAGELIIACRRLLVIAYEDIGLGNPQATERTVAAVEAAEKLGLPEARIPLAFATVELALSPKSNTTMMALDNALADIRSGNVGPIPDHLRDAHYSGAAKLGRGVEYKYPHSYPGHWVLQQYLPDNVKSKQYFKPDPTGKYEEALANVYKKIKSQS
ncbi:replication-associated recombination protein A [Globicatella sanguinis]|uniref:replication-associated recombination protein A n=1 Tax=Globicatella sanguinis TaxID=13076 RepID=UPI002542B89E|nr:replication-associated recombination protein A [Globicatella sanguinis]MDK7630571.1 replication-associated recombination protein A [Globicatella sanguinis]WIK66739.1 replication-associated recombination protein A [Globicatella sanguinis]WKT56144.1 replication-associated recombination protein A [Globicatella sanguinis]